MAHTLTVEFDQDIGHFITLSQEILDQLDWKEGDKLVWKDNGDGSWTLKKKKKKKTQLVLVETVSTFRHRYMIELAEGDDPTWALDTVTMKDANEFSQKHIDESIISHRIVDRDEFLALCDEDNGYASTWSNEEKFDAFATSKKDK